MVVVAKTEEGEERVDISYRVQSYIMQKKTESQIINWKTETQEDGKRERMLACRGSAKTGWAKIEKIHFFYLYIFIFKRGSEA